MDMFDWGYLLGTLATGCLFLFMWIMWALMEGNK